VVVGGAAIRFLIAARLADLARFATLRFRSIAFYGFANQPELLP